VKNPLSMVMVSYHDPCPLRIARFHVSRGHILRPLWLL